MQLNKKYILSFLQNDLVSQSVKVLIIRVIGVGVFFALTLFLTNFFSPENVGLYDFSRSLLMVLGGISILGMNQSILYYAGYLKSQKSIQSLKSVYSKMLLMILLVSIVLLFLVLIINRTRFDSFFEKEVYDLIVKSTIILFFYSITILNIEVYRAINKIYMSEIYRGIIRFTPFFVGAIIIYFLDAHQLLVDIFLFSFILLGCVSTISLYYYFPKDNETFKVNISTKEIFKRSSPMAISSMAFILMQGVDIILLSKFTNFKMVAYYAVAVKLTMMVSLVLASVNAVNAPKIAELHNLGDYKMLKDNLKKASRLIFVLTMPAIIIMVFFSKTILTLFGEDYIVAQNTLYALLVGQTVNAFCGSVGVYMNMTGKQNILQYFLLFAFVINLALNWILIPKYNILGAAIATSLSMIVWNIFGAIYLVKKEKIKTFLN